MSRPVVTTRSRACTPCSDVLPVLWSVLPAVWLRTISVLLVFSIFRASAESLTLPEALEAVTHVHPAHAAAAQRIEAARAAWVQAGRWKNPEVELRAENLLFRAPLVDKQPSIDFFATVTQWIEIGGKPRLRQAVAFADQERAAAEREKVELELRLSTLALYFAALQNASEEQVLIRGERELEQLAAIARRRAAEGHSAPVEVLKLESEQGRLVSQRSELHAATGRALEALRLLLARSEPLSAEQLVEPPPIQLPDGPAERLVDVAVRQHPEYKLRYAGQARAESQLAYERARQFPDPAITAGYKRTESTDTWVTAVTVPLPLFDTNRGNVHRALAERRAAAADVDSVEVELRTQLFQLWDRARELHGRAQRLPQDLLEPAEGVLRAARAAFQEGQGDLLAMVDATRVHTEAERAVGRTRLEAAATAYLWKLLTAPTIAR